MPKNTVEKNTKDSKKTTGTTKKTTGTAKKTTTKKASPVKTKNVKSEKKETKVVKKVEPVKVKPAEKEKKVEIRKEEKKDNLITRITSDTPLLVSLCIIVVLIALVIFLACEKRIPKVKNGDEILASVKGKDFTATDLYESLKEQYGTDSLITVIDEYIADKEVTFTKDDEDYVKEVVDYYKKYADYYGVDLETFLINYVGITGVKTEEEFKNFVTKDYKKTLAVVKFIGDNADKKDLEKYYNENYSDSIKVRHILIQVEDDNDKAALNTAKKVISKLKDEKDVEKKFIKLAEEYSDDTGSYANGGLIESATITSVVKPFWEAASKLKDGEYTTEPVKTEYGYHVILRLSSTPVEKYEDIEDKVKKAYAESLLQNDQSLQIKKWDELRKQYKLNIIDDEVKSAYEKTIKEATKDDKKEESSNEKEEN